MHIHPMRPAFLLGLFATCALLCGCGSREARKMASLNSTNIDRLGNLYSAFQTGRGGPGPRDEAEFKAFITNMPKEQLQLLGVDSTKVDALFISERDGKPFKIRFKVSGGRGSVDAVIFEQDGVGGMRQVGFTGKPHKDVGDIEYEAMLAGNGPSVQPSGPPVQPPTAGKSKAKGGAPSGRPPGAPTGPS
jgi:hypothetical protein